MVRCLRATVGVSNGGNAITEVRKTQDGRLLVAFQKGEPERGAVKNLISANWEGAKVSEGRRESARQTIHVKGLDEGVENSEVKEAICGVFPGLEMENIEVGPRRPMYGGNFAVTVRVAGRDFRQMDVKKKTRIGFNMCTIEKRAEVGKCFRCWDFGHHARKCKGPDRSSRCSCCGQEGHQAAWCRNDSFCLLCEVGGHRGGSGRCPKFREALMAKREWVRGSVEPAPQTDSTGLEGRQLRHPDVISTQDGSGVPLEERRGFSR